ncbi:peptidase domain-containing ABC transporter [Glutamicibacter uratoxydans]|uniref:peptidase domain-containing ABC transporter n=1 Tax=Glutamicibacter uratoxydans TaxID=43667 RepID=UPI003D6E7E4E
MSRPPVILQTADTDCAAACLSAILRFKGHTVSLAGVRAEMDPGRDGSSGRIIRASAARWGLGLKALLADPEELVSRITELQLPLIMHLSRGHYVVVEGARGSQIFVMDPAVGRRTIAAEELAEEASGMVLIIAEEQKLSSDQLPPESRQRTLSLLKDILLSVRRDFGWAATLSALLAVFGLALPVATALIVDSMIANDLPQQRWMVLGIGLAAVVGVLSLARYWILSTLQYRLAGSLSKRVASTLFSRSMKFFDRRSVGDMVGRVDSAHAIHSLLSVTLLGAALDAILTISYLVALLLIAPSLALTTGVIIFSGLGLALWVAAKCAALRREEILVTAESSTLMVDSINGMNTLRAYQAEQGALKEWQELLQRRLALTRSRTRLNALALALLAAMAVITPLIILLQASSTTSLGLFNQISPGAALGLMGLAAATLTPVTSLATQLVGAADLRPLLDRVEDLDSAPAAEIGQLSAGTLSGQLRLESVSFRHERHGREVLSQISGEVAAGSKLCILGPTGGGKSTLAQLMAGLQTPSVGRVLIDEQDLRELTPESLRPQIGVVFQDNWLSRGTIRDAVLAGREGYDDESVWRALARAQLAAEIIELPLGIDTRLGSSGTGLSGGQRQRLAWARALLADPKILILDEPTSALDAHTEAMIEQVLRELSITRIVITHRLDVAADADEIWVVNHGQITERGTPEELSGSQGWYASLIRGRSRV